MRARHKARSNQHAAFLTVALLTAAIAHAAPDAMWWYREPAAGYWEGLPLANGRLAAMVYGRVRDELIPLNDDTLWSGSPYDPNNPAGRAALPEIRQLLFAGKYREAQALCTKLLSVPLSVQHYQPLGELRIRFDGPTEATDYRRELDMDSALARVTYRIGDTRYTREIFASYPDQVLVVRIAADKPGRISLAVRLASIQPSAGSRREPDGAISMAGTAATVTEGRSANPVIPAKMRWESQVRILREGGSIGSCHIAQDEDRTAACTSVTHANAVTLVLTAATNYVRWNDITANPESLVAARMRAADKPYRTLLGRHLRDWQPRFSAFRLDLGGREAAERDTTTRLDLLRRGAKDPLFTAQYVQYGRYLLLAVSRPGTLAFNNHNVWLNNMEGRWAGRWTLNINLQECYWPAENTSLPQTNDALIGFVEQLAEAGARTARELYGCRGWVAHHGTDIWMNTAPTDGTGPGIWPTAGPWLLQNLWEHYLFEPDPQYLKRLYPLLRGASEFFLDFLVEEPTHHWLVTAPSVSPENSFFTSEGQPTQVCMGPTMDNQLLRDLFDHTAQASRLLGVDSELRSLVESARRRLAPDRVGKHGQIEEWLHAFDEPEVTHRHLSPLYGFFPSNQIAAATSPDLVRAVGMTLARRTDKNLGWSGAWKINLYARLGDGEHAEEILNRMLVEISLHPTKEDSNRVPSLEGNQGIQAVTAGVAEMLLQSHEGELRLLPALPRDWPTGHVEGLRARGGFVVAMDWRNDALERVVVHSTLGGECRLRYGTSGAGFTTRAGQQYQRNGQLQ
jgi:alpha-L-fucosidase 2